MKIILQGLNMKSDIMEVPENTTATFQMVLTQPTTLRTSLRGEKPSDRPIATLCDFQWCGKVDMKTGARIYRLKDIRKQ